VTEPLKPLIIDIETSGLNPWESRITVIGVKDVIAQEEPIVQFSDPDEMKMLEDFLAFFHAGGYNQIIGFNVGFDYRFLYAACMRYRLQCPEVVAAKLWDIAEIVKQVKTSYVFNTNKQGDLDSWSRYLLNMKKTMTAEEMLTAWDEGRILDILVYNENDVLLEYYLWGLIKYTNAEVSAVQQVTPTSAQSASSSGSSTPIRVQCPYCIAENLVPAGRQSYVCDICGKTVEL
jgi:ribosomal protein S27E